jgi:NADPH:quinone reductase
MSYPAKAARIHSYGPPEVLTFEDIEVEAPGPGQVLVRNKVLGLNFVDVYYRRGTFPVPGFPFIIGNEAAGVVAAVGDGVHGYRIGDRVAYCDDINGAYATTRLYDADRLIGIPDDITDEQVCTVLLKGLTARYLLKEVTPLQPGDTLLYHAAAGGVGQLFTQWGNALGFEIIGTVSTQEKAEIARQHGCAHVINYSTEDFVARVMEITDGKGVRATFDAVGKDTFVKSLQTLAVKGMLVVFGKASGDLPDVNPFTLAPRALQLSWPILPNYVVTSEELNAAASDLFEAVRSGIVPAQPGTVYPFDRLVDAHRELEERRTTGATILRVE